jgi:hypothetical protein
MKVENLKHPSILQAIVMILDAFLIKCWFLDFFKFKKVNISPPPTQQLMFFQNICYK